jgi:hypothetical protein
MLNDMNYDSAVFFVKASGFPKFSWRTASFFHSWKLTVYSNPNCVGAVLNVPADDASVIHPFWIKTIS